jgi:hypothetical protein
MNMLRLAALIALTASPVFAGYTYYAELDCTFALAGCDMDRDTGGTCPYGAAATARLWAEGENWYLSTKGVNNSEDASGANEETFGLYVSMTEPVRSYFIGLHDKIDGTFTHDTDGKASLHILVDRPDILFEEHFEGTCGDPAP